MSAKYQLEIQNILKGDWLRVDNIALGATSLKFRTADLYVFVKKDNISYLRIDIYIDSKIEICFTEKAIIWNNWVVIGCGSHVYFVSLGNRLVRTYFLENYFAYFYPQLLGFSSDNLLITSAEKLYLFDNKGNLQWSVGDLGLDGVIIENIKDGMVFGKGLIAPLDSWKAFHICLHTGKLID